MRRLATRRLIKKPLLLMRKKNILGTYFFKYATFTQPIKSVGGAVEKGVIP